MSRLLPKARAKVLVGIAFLCCPCAAQMLRAGAASAVVTPDIESKQLYMAGFGHNRVARAVHDDLYARCLALNVRRKTLVLCSVDVIGLFYDDVLDSGAQLHHFAPEAELIVAATHNHEGPDTVGLWGPDEKTTGLDQGYLAWLKQRIAETAARAVRGMQPAKMELGRDDDPSLGQLQSVDRPPTVKDAFVFVLRVRTTTGRAIATLVNWSDHPETLARNREITADYPHWVRQYVEAHGGGMALFFSGKVGKVSSLGADVTLRDPATGTIAEDGSWRKAELLGNAIGEAAISALRPGEAVNVDAMVIRRSTLFVPLENQRFRIAEALGLLGGRKPLFTAGRLDRTTSDQVVKGVKMAVPAGRDLQTEVEYVELRAGAKVVAEFVTVPGEIYPELVNGGIQRYAGADYPDAPFEPVLRPQLKSRHGFILGLANDELGYLIPKAEWDEQPPWLQDAPKPWYGEINSVGPDAAAAVLNALSRVIAGRQ